MSPSLCCLTFKVLSLNIADQFLPCFSKSAEAHACSLPDCVLRAWPRLPCSSAAIRSRVATVCVVEPPDDFGRSPFGACAVNICSSSENSSFDKVESGSFKDRDRGSRRVLSVTVFPLSPSSRTRSIAPVTGSRSMRASPGTSTCFRGGALGSARLSFIGRSEAASLEF